MDAASSRVEPRAATSNAKPIGVSDAANYNYAVAHQDMVRAKTNIATKRVFAVDLAVLNVTKLRSAPKQRHVVAVASVAWRLITKLRRTWVL